MRYFREPLVAFFIVFLFSQLILSQEALSENNQLTATLRQPLNVPSWVTNPPEHCFVGISKPCPSIEEARTQAINSAVSEILQTMGADYSLSHESILLGDLNYSKYNLKERLNFTANWFLESVQENVQKFEFEEVEKGYVCFVLITLSPSKIESLKKLSIGPKLTAEAIKTHDTKLTIEIKEINDVGITLTGFQGSIKTINHHARLITLFAFKVPIGHTERINGVFDHKLNLKNSTETATINLQSKKHHLKSLILGSDTIIKILLTGHDTIGRPVTVPVIIQN